MIRIVTLIIVIFSFSLSNYSQYSCEKLALPVEGNLIDIWFTHPDTGFVTGSKTTKEGFILKTTDGGLNWEEMDISSAGKIGQVRNIQFVSAKIGFAYAEEIYRSLILKTIDKGATWNVIKDSIKTRIEDFHFYNENLGYAATLDQDIFKISDGGKTFSPLGLLYNGSEIQALASSVYVKDIDTLITLFHGGDYPIEFNVVSESELIIPDGIVYNYELKDIYFTDSKVGFIVGLNYRGQNNEGIVLLSNNGGNYYEAHSIPKQKVDAGAGLTKIHMLNSDVGVSVGQYYTSPNYITSDTSYIVTTSDGGKNWEEQNFHREMNINGVFQVDNNHFFIVGDTADAGGAVYLFSQKPKSINIELTELLELHCSDTLTLNPIINYTGSKELSYSWEPEVGLLNPNTRNPLLSASIDMEYQLTVTDGLDSQKTVINIDIIPYDPPQICMVTHNPELNSNTIYVNKNTLSAIKEYRIYSDSNGVDKLIGYIHPDSAGVFQDKNTQRVGRSATYKISFVDSACELESPLSKIHQTLFLQADKPDEKKTQLKWNNYENGSISGYTVFKGMKGELNEVAVVNTNSYLDTVVNEGSVSYQVAAMLPISCSELPDLDETLSYSNIAKVNSQQGLPVFHLKWKELQNNISIKLSEIDSVCINDSVNLDTLFTIISEGTYKKFWSSSSLISDQEITTNTIQVTSDTTLYLLLIESNGCWLSDSININAKQNCGTTSNVLMNQFLDIALYPNPNKGLFVLELSNKTAKNFRVDIYDALRRQVFMKQYKNQQELTEQIELNVPAGYYILRFSDKENSLSMPLIIR